MYNLIYSLTIDQLIDFFKKNTFLVDKIIIGFLGLILLFSCSPSKGKTEFYEENLKGETVVDVESLYILHCESCHGLDGKKGISGAADLSKSKFSDKEIIHVIENGNNKGMMPYKEIIPSKNERISLMEFVKNLRK